jgi:DNA replication factor GINS
MYGELYRAWKSEAENRELQKLSADFYPRICQYMRKLKEEGRMLDKRTLKTTLLKREMQNASSIIRSLIRIRHHKNVLIIVKGGKIDKENLTPEELMIYSRTSDFSEMIRSFSKDVVRGQVARPKLGVETKRVLLHFLKEVPQIVGADLKTYGPFKEEDIATLPLDNSKILVKQGLAELVEVS